MPGDIKLDQSSAHEMSNAKFGASRDMATTQRMFGGKKMESVIEKQNLINKAPMSNTSSGAF